MRQYGRIYRGKPIRDYVRREVREIQGRSRRKERKKGKATASVKKQVEIGKTLKDMWVIGRRDRNENAFARPKGLRGSADTAISCR